VTWRSTQLSTPSHNENIPSGYRNEPAALSRRGSAAGLSRPALDAPAPTLGIMTFRRRLIVMATMTLVMAGCSERDEQATVSVSEQSIVPSSTPPSSVVPPTSPTTTPATTAPSTGTTSPTVMPTLGNPQPDWLGTIELVLREGEDNGVAQATPRELVDRQLWTEDVLAPPRGADFVSSMQTPPPPGVLARSTWRAECPVRVEDLTYAQVSFVGFDGLFHTGEFILHRDFAARVVDIFEVLHATAFPIEEMRVTTQEAVDAHPTGDSNNTSSFVCRPAVNSGRWSRHAHGGAIDINPFHNPYVKGDLVIPELATAYLDRNRDVPGLITSEIEAMFSELGWGWGGNWSSASDWMHFSDTGG
jgi:hypothetical protein